ncbi:hypothetical protein DPEC_G00305440 [Dallia pectoralis]|uniref:Uncharacterized protein n=1 Tax=Dallia pectoralis TaxID=75939 RepID=A0ACC2FDS4_DALPE|nr:hypothetical protein DPEC_G00305440 [Dallia pectoralis]
MFQDHEGDHSTISTRAFFSGLVVWTHVGELDATTLLGDRPHNKYDVTPVSNWTRLMIWDFWKIPGNLGNLK